MKNFTPLLAKFAALFLVLSVSGAAQETIVAIRHAEKPDAGLGQLNCQGLNRALALPQVLIPRYGPPAAIFAPDPAEQVSDRSQTLYSYLRPLITIEPTAIAVGMPVNAQIGFTDIIRLQDAVTAPVYANALVYISWEHLLLNRFAQQLLTSYGKDPSVLPDWPNSDYDRIYIFKIAPAAGPGGKPQLTFTIEHEGLDGHLSDTCPTPKP
jgi:hypothetical protein